MQGKGVDRPQGGAARVWIHPVVQYDQSKECECVCVCVCVCVGLEGQEGW